jgi:hypothetical protein
MYSHLLVSSIEVLNCVGNSPLHRANGEQPHGRDPIRDPIVSYQDVSRLPRTGILIGEWGGLRGSNRNLRSHNPMLMFA